MNISAIVLAKNEDARIDKCLESLSFVDEIIVIDNGSTDNTAKTAIQKNAIVIKSDAYSFAERRNIGLRKAKSEWILYVDADEIVSKELRKEIQKLFIDHTSHMRGYEIRRKNYYLGYPWPGDEYIVRLMRRDALIEWRGELHETAHVNGEIGRLNNFLFHNTHRTLEEMVDKTNHWSDVEAKLRFNAGHPTVVWWRFIRVMWTAFYDSFIKQGGWRAGEIGWIESLYQSYSIFITYSKLWEIQKNRSS